MTPAIRSGGGGGRHGERKKNVPSWAVWPDKHIDLRTRAGVKERRDAEAWRDRSSAALRHGSRATRAQSSSASCARTSVSAFASRMRDALKPSAHPRLPAIASDQRTATPDGWATSPNGGEASRARRNRPDAAGATSRSATLSAPADCPATVTRPGSPPKSWTFSLHPAQGGDLIEQTPVRHRRPRRLREIRMAEPAETAEPVIDRHDDKVAGLSQPGASVDARGAVTDREAAAVHPEQHRPRTLERGREDVQIQALLGRVGQLAVREGRNLSGWLRRSGTRPGPVTDAGPGGRRGGRRPAGRRRKRDAEEGLSMLVVETLEPPGGRLNHGHERSARGRCDL